MNKLAIAVAMSALAAGCAATNAFVHLAPDYSSLPADALRKAAAEIEATVAAGEESFNLESSDTLQLDTPEIRQAVRTRAIRANLVSDLLDSGFAIEERNGLIAVKRTSDYKKATTSRQRDRDALVVMSENDNRWTIYEGLLKANEWSPRSLSAVQEIFFEARVPLMKPGQQHEAAGAP